MGIYYMDLVQDVFIKGLLGFMQGVLTTAQLEKPHALLSCQDSK